MSVTASFCMVSEIDIAREQLRLAQDNVQSQRQHIEELKAKGYSTVLATELLTHFERTLCQRQEHLDSLLKR